MFTQSKNVIVYQQEQWAITLVYVLLLPILAFALWMLEAAFDPYRFFLAHSLGDILRIAALPIVGATSVGIWFARTATLDRMNISTEGFTYTRGDTVRHYSWSRLRDPEFVACGKGSGYYRVDPTDGDKPIKVSLPPFAMSRKEFEYVMSSARHGQLPDITGVRREMPASDLPLIPTLAVMCVPIALMLLMHYSAQR